MDKKEQDILDKLKSKTDDIKAPESITPDNMKNKLVEKKVRWLTPKKLGLMAAVLAVALGVGIVYQTRFVNQDSQSTKATGGKEIAVADKYTDIYKYIKASQRGTKELYSLDGVGAVEESASVSADSIAKSADASTSYTDTNVRQTGVSEGDIVKADGKYLYILKNNRDSIAIVDAGGKSLKEISVLKPEGFSHIVEIYVENDKLVLVGSSSVMTAKPLDLARDTEEIMPAYSGNEDLTLALTYDISNKEEPKLLGELKQSGFYQSSRMVNGYLYMFSDYTIYENGGKGQPETYIPMVNQELFDVKDILLPITEVANRYTVITAMSLDEPDKSTSSKAILAQYGNYYVSNDNIYYYEEQWNDGEKTRTIVRKLSYKNGELEAVAKGEFNGYLNDSYSIDEYEGKLRVVTTDEDFNNLYILDEKLEQIGVIQGLAPGERVYSARFMGDIGYFVTFKQVDPLFSVDLSDPANPKVMGALKIPGFSQYLHPYSDGLLLGIGMDADEETGITDGIKLSMFDISNPEDVKEIDKELLSTDYYSELFYNYKGFLFDGEKGIFGFSTEGEGGLSYNLYTYDEKGFNPLMKVEVTSSGYMETRGVIIDNILYVINGNIVESYSLDTHSKLQSIIL